MRVENQIKSSLCPGISIKNAIEEFHLWSFLCQDYDDFDVANEDDLLEEFLGLPRKNPKVGGIPVVPVSIPTNRKHFLEHVLLCTCTYIA
jgi:hypothetical protein